MIIEKIQELKQGTPIPKPKGSSEFKIKGVGMRRGEAALTYWIPNLKNPSKPYVKGITFTEFARAFDQLLESAQLTRSWFNANLEPCAKEGSCNFSTLGGVFQLLGVAHYVCPGTYALNSKLTAGAGALDQLGLDAMFDEILVEVINEQETETKNWSVVDGAMNSLEIEKKAKFKAAIEELGKIFAPDTKSNNC